VNVSQAPARPRPRARHFTLNTDGRRHPLINAAATYTIGTGLASFVLGMLSLNHFLVTVLGVTGFVVGLLAQMVSVTRAERIFIVFGIVASFVGMGLGFAHGGFSIGSGGGTGIS
jgi:small-conductance mechanosensitive channel